MKTKQVVLSSAALLLLSAGVITSLDGDIAGMFGSKEKPPCENAARVLTQVGEQNIHDQWQGKSAPYLMQGGWEAEADFIYWRTDEDGLEYVTSTTVSNGDTRFSSKTHKPATRWDPGFKLGIGYTFGTQDFWDLFFRWTYFNTHQSGTAPGITIAEFENGEKDLEPWWQPSFVGQATTTARANWSLRYNTYDLELGRHYFISRTTAMRPHFGLRGATIGQEYSAHYNGIFSLTSMPPFEEFPTHFKTKADFWGVGIRAGTSVEWHFTNRWAIVGSIAGSLLYGNFNVKEHQQGVETLNGTSFLTTNDSLTVELSRVSPNIEAALGIQWDMFFFKDKYHCAVALGYEFSEWFSQNQVVRSEVFDNGTAKQVGVVHFEHSPGDLGLQGATLKVVLDF